MKAMTTDARYTKCQNAAHRLQVECWERGPKLKKRFTPCPKGLVYVEEMAAGNKRAMSVVWPDVCATPCKCHPDFGPDQCIEYENDTRFNPAFRK